MNKLRESLKRKLTKSELSMVPSSFDIVGDIAIFNEFPKELKKKEKMIADAMLKIQKNVKVVAKKSKKYSGRLRTPKITILAGEKRKTTVHRESGCLFRLDVEKCYFSARTGYERLRIAKKVKKSESILVMFSGIAAFPIVISKNKKPKEIYAVELNKTAHKFAEENIKLNKTTNIMLLKGDVKKVVPTLKKKFDRIIMPLPKSAEKYLPLAKRYLKPDGTIHLYTFSQERDFKELRIKYKIKKIVKCGNYSPGVYRVCLDLNNFKN
ncbi:MAG: class I SAM-dependent methyltransferase family protein [Nanoarchaeota archaeon]|nr:class I SAM-dependent methyltransferase family protein [Nanoarchaeota archaeon]